MSLFPSAPAKIRLRWLSSLEASQQLNYLDDKLKVVVVGVALQKTKGEAAKMIDKQIKIARDTVLNIDGHIRPRAETHEVDKVREDERILTRVTSITSGAASGSPIDERGFGRALAVQTQMGSTLGSGCAASAGNHVPAFRPLPRAPIMFFRSSCASWRTAT
jgi:hypothetical protein